VAVLGSSAFEQLQLKRGSSRCTMPLEGLVVARCSFANNTAALTGGCWVQLLSVRRVHLVVLAWASVSSMPDGGGAVCGTLQPTTQQRLQVGVSLHRVLMVCHLIWRRDVYGHKVV
jgi:hypothetical protein